MAKKRSNIQNVAELLAVRTLLGFIGVFPLRTSMNLGRRVGAFLGRRLKRLRKTARRNLEIAFPDIPDAERERLIDGTFESLGRQLGLVAHLGRLSLEEVRDLIEVEGCDNIREVEAMGTGVLLFTGHFGSWEIFNAVPPAHGYKMSILVRRIDNPLVEKLVDSFRTRFGNETLDKMKATRSMYRLLKKGQYLGILGDLNAQHREGIFVDFFGVPACSTTSIAKLALATDVPIVPGFAVWDEARQRYVARFEPALDFVRTGDHDTDVHTITQLVANVIESYVRRYPDQWMWIHKRWNTRPDGEKGLY